MRLNEVFLFPFEKVEKGSKIILYGLGSVGRSFYNQVTTLEYCEVLAVADRRASYYEEVRYPIILPEQIREYMYDYIVISIVSEVIAGKIKNDLMTQYNVEEDKIVFLANRKVPIHLADTNLEQIMKSNKILSRELYAFEVTKDGDMQYFSNIINEMSQVKMLCDIKKADEIKQYFIDYLKTEKSVRNQIVVLRILYAAGYFDGELLEKYLNSISKLKDYAARIWLVYDASVMERNDQNYRYKNFYLDKRKLIEENAFYYGKRLMLPTIKRENNNRVAITTFGLGKASSSHNALIMPYANEMVRQGKEVGIFPIDLLRYRYGECFIQPLEPIEQKSEGFADDHNDMLEPEVKVFYSSGEDMEERISDTLKKLYEFAPQVVYDFCGEYSYLSPLIKEKFPIIALPMRGYSSSACFDIYMCRSKEICTQENQKYPSMTEEQMVESLICSVPQKAEKEFKRTDFGISETDFVITTVGNRLKTELTGEFVDCVCSFLEEHENAIWILVGGKICTYVHEKYSEYIRNGQIIEWGFEEDLVGFYMLCDIYWNPNRMGAGGSIGMAMRSGVPIVTTTFPSDVLPRLGKENAIDGTYEDCRLYVEKLYQDSRLYNEKSELMKELMRVSGIPQYIEKLLAVGQTLCLERGYIYGNKNCCDNGNKGGFGTRTEKIIKKKIL